MTGASASVCPILATALKTTRNKGTLPMIMNKPALCGDSDFVARGMFGLLVCVATGSIDFPKGKFEGGVAKANGKPFRSFPVL